MPPHEPAAGTASPEARDAVHGSSVVSPGTDLAPSPLERTVLGLASYALVGGGITLVGWFTNVPRLTDWLATGISMFPNTALAALCCGAALIFATRKRRWSAHVAVLLGGIVLILGAATLLQHLARIDLGIDTEERLSALAAIVEFSQDPILSKSLDGIVTSWNSAAEKFFGYSAAEIIGQPVNLIIPRDRLAGEGSP